MASDRRVDGIPRSKTDGERHYPAEWDGYESVTTITGWHPEKKKAISEWRRHVGAEEAERIKNDAAVLGTLVHHRILREYAVRRLPKPEIDMAHAYDGIKTDIDTCLALWDDLSFEIERSPLIEERIVNHEHGYKGTFDMLTDGTVVDLKTSSAIRDSHKWQIAAYWHAVNDLPSFGEATDAAIIRLDPDPDTNPHLKPHVERLNERELQANFDTFSGLIEKYG